MRDERARMIARSPKSSPPPDMRRPMIAFAALLLRAAAASASPQPQAPPLVIGPVFGQDYGGADYATVFLNSSLDRSTDHFKAVAEECLARCVTDARCCAWTYCLPHSATEPGPERCCLKSSVPPLNSKNGCGWTGLAPRAVGLNNTVSSLCGGGTRPPVPPSPPPSTFNSTAQFHPRTAAGGTQDASGVIQTADGRWHIFPDCHPLHDPAQTNNKSFLPPRGYGGMGWAHLSSDDLVTWIDHGMAMQPGRARTGGYVPFDENYDNMLMDTGSMSTLPNGSVFAVISAINETSLPSTYDGNIIGALAQDPQLLRFQKFGTMIPNPTKPNRPPQNNGTDTPTPGQLPRYSFRDPTTPWLDSCEPDSGLDGKQCWFVLIGSGNFTHNNALLYRSASDTDIETHWQFEKVLWVSQTSQVFDHACPGYFCIYSCPDFFRLTADTWFFGSLDQEYWLGSYENHTFTPNEFYRDKPGMLLDSTIWKTGAKAGWWDRSKPPGRRLMWGGYRSMMTMPRELGVGANGELALQFAQELVALRNVSLGAAPETTIGKHLEIVVEFSAKCKAAGATGYGLRMLNTTTITFNGTYLVVDGPQISNGVNGGHYSPLNLKAAESLLLHVFLDGSTLQTSPRYYGHIVCRVVPH